MRESSEAETKTESARPGQWRSSRNDQIEGSGEGDSLAAPVLVGIIVISLAPRSSGPAPRRDHSQPSSSHAIAIATLLLLPPLAIFFLPHVQVSFNLAFHLSHLAT